MATATLGLILFHARSTGMAKTNAVEEWKHERKTKSRRRSAASYKVTPDMVLTSEELEQLLNTAQHEFRDHYALILFLAHTGARLGEAAALRWSDVDLAAGTARIARSFSSGRYLGPTKTGQVRAVELSSKLREMLLAMRPDLFPQDALAFPNDTGGFIDPTNFRRRVFTRLVRKAIGPTDRKISPHTLRHTWCSLHLARSTNLLWVQRQGGWKSAQTLLQHYTHFIPSELSGYADAIASPDGTRRHQPEERAQGRLRGEAKRCATPRRSVVSAPGFEPGTGGLRVRCSSS
jgi:integrase